MCSIIIGIVISDYASIFTFASNPLLSHWHVKYFSEFTVSLYSWVQL